MTQQPFSSQEPLANLPQDYPLVGKWEMKRMDFFFRGTQNNPDNWQQEAVFDPDELIWYFETDGMLTEYAEGRSVNKTVYRYNPESGKLYIDRSIYEEDGGESICQNDIYHVEFMTANSLRLYNHENENGISKNCPYRFEAERIGRQK